MRSTSTLPGHITYGEQPRNKQYRTGNLSFTSAKKIIELAEGYPIDRYQFFTEYSTQIEYSYFLETIKRLSSRAALKGNTSLVIGLLALKGGALEYQALTKAGIE
jgi:hypothetical protein